MPGIKGRRPAGQRPSAPSGGRFSALGFRSGVGGVWDDQAKTSAAGRPPGGRALPGGCGVGCASAHRGAVGGAQDAHPKLAGLSFSFDSMDDSLLWRNSKSILGKSQILVTSGICIFHSVSHNLHINLRDEPIKPLFADLIN